MSTTTSPRTLLAAVAVAGSIVSLSACGGSSEASTGDQLVASLQTESSDATTGTVDAEPALTPDEAALALSECLRDEGLDVGDIPVGADGEIDMQGTFQALDPQQEGFRDGMEACGDILDGVGFGGGRGALADDPAIADAFLEFSDCVRDEGFEDIPDLTAGRLVPGDDGEGPPGGGQGTREGGFGDRATIFAERLALDPDDPDVVAAIDTCLPIIDQAFSDAGVAPRGQG